MLCVGCFTASYAQGVKLKAVVDSVGYVVMMDF
jgi:hypothetical protein